MSILLENCHGALFYQRHMFTTDYHCHLQHFIIHYITAASERCILYMQDCTDHCSEDCHE